MFQISHISGLMFPEIDFFLFTETFLDYIIIVMMMIFIYFEHLDVADTWN